MSNEMSIFDLEANSFKTENKSGGSDLYKPSADKGSAGVYTSLIRFLPNIRNPKKSKITKHSHWLTDGEGNGHYFDCPTTVGEKCIACSKFFELKDSESAIEQERAKNFRRQTSHFHLVQIIDDKQNPDLNGQIMVFKMGYTLNLKYEALLEPDYGKPVIPADLFSGKNFILKITKKGGWNNYDQSHFAEQKSAIKIDGVEMNRNNKEHLQLIKTHLEENSPELERYDYKPWTDEELKKVRSIVNGNSASDEEVDSSIADMTQELEETSSPQSETISGDDADSLADIEAATSEEEVDDMEDDLDFDDDDDFLADI